EAFLFRVYASTRELELAVVPWSDEQKNAFLSMQFQAQSRSYRDQFPKADYQVISRAGADLGRLIVNRTTDYEDIRLIDIALLPEHRNAGIGTALIKDLLDEATRTERPLRLHVETYNPAYHLYERLGFKKIADEGVYWQMEWRARTAAGTV